MRTRIDHQENNSDWLYQIHTYKKNVGINLSLMGTAIPIRHRRNADTRDRIVRAVMRHCIISICLIGFAAIIAAFKIIIYTMLLFNVSVD